MKKKILFGFALFVTAGLYAQNTESVDLLKKQLQELRQNFEKSQREQLLQIEALSKKIDQLSPPPPAGDQKKLEAELAAELAREPAPPAKSTPGASSSWSPSQPIPVMRAGGSYMNISFDALMDAGGSTASDPSRQLNLGDHDPSKRGFSLRNAEIALDGNVDPYFKGFANIVLKLDNNNETSIELEEVYAQSTSLPFNLQVKAGQFFANFGRQNSQHPHQWAFVDAPIMLTRAFGPDGLRNIGAQLSWLAPTPFYTELFLGVFDGQGGTTHSFRNPGEPDLAGVNRFAGRTTFDRNLRGPQDLLFTPRIASSFQLGDEQTLVAGVSGAFGANDTSPTARTEIYGADLYWKWKPVNAMEGFPFVSWQTEGLFRRFGAGADVVAGLPAANLHDYGFYSQILWGFQPHWVAGVRGEWASGNSDLFDPLDPFRGERYRVSPVLTWYPSEFSKLRLQYNFDHGRYFETAHSIWLQMEFLLGAHGAHKF